MPTSAPEEVFLAFDVLVRCHGEFVNGVRLVYPMQEEAMRFINLIGNDCFVGIQLAPRPEDP